MSSRKPKILGLCFYRKVKWFFCKSSQKDLRRLLAQVLVQRRGIQVDFIQCVFQDAFRGSHPAGRLRCDRPVHWNEAWNGLQLPAFCREKCHGRTARMAEETSLQPRPQDSRLFAESRRNHAGKSFIESILRHEERRPVYPRQSHHDGPRRQKADAFRLDAACEVTTASRRRRCGGGVHAVVRRRDASATPCHLSVKNLAKVKINLCTHMHP